MEKEGRRNTVVGECGRGATTGGEKGDEYIAVIIAIDFYRQTITFDSWRLPSCSDDAFFFFFSFSRSLLAFAPLTRVLPPFFSPASCFSLAVIAGNVVNARGSTDWSGRGKCPLTAYRSSLLGDNRIILFLSSLFFIPPSSVLSSFASSFFSFALLSFILASPPCPATENAIFFSIRKNLAKRRTYVCTWSVCIFRIGHFCADERSNGSWLRPSVYFHLLWRCSFSLDTCK